MKLELKKIRYSEHASQETSNFVAELYVDGKPFSIVNNDGIGGCDCHNRHPKNKVDYKEFHKELLRIEKWYNENVKIESKYSEKGYIEGTLDIAVGEVLDKWLIEKQVKSLTSRNLVVFENNDKGGYYKYGKRKYKLTDEWKVDILKNKFKKWHGEHIILNDLPLDEACALFKNQAGYNFTN